MCGWTLAAHQAKYLFGRISGEVAPYWVQLGSFVIPLRGPLSQTP
jgi:hypothetical protein